MRIETFCNFQCERGSCFTLSSHCAEDSVVRGEVDSCRVQRRRRYYRICRMHIHTYIYTHMYVCKRFSMKAILASIVRLCLYFWKMSESDTVCIGTRRSLLASCTFCIQFRNALHWISERLTMRVCLLLVRFWPAKCIAIYWRIANQNMHTSVCTYVSAKRCNETGALRTSLRYLVFTFWQLISAGLINWFYSVMFRFLKNVPSAVYLVKLCKNYFFK